MSTNHFQTAKKEIEKICIDSPDRNCEQVFCKLHNTEYLGTDTSSSHACLACNLNDSLEKIHKFLASLKRDDDIEYSFTVFTLLTYLTVEKLTIIFKHIGITQEYVESNWKVLIEIRKWANFVKHPKGFLFSHHPEYAFENEKIESKYKAWKKLNYNNFIEPLYKKEDEGKYKETISQIGNKKDILVIIPNPERIIKDLSIVCNAFCEKVKNNEHFKEILKTQSVLEEYNVT